MNNNLVTGWEEDMSLSESSDSDDTGLENNLYFDETVKNSSSHESNITNKSTTTNKYFIDFTYIHDQDMNYYQETYSYYQDNEFSISKSVEEFNNQSMLGSIEVPNSNPCEDDYDPDYDLEVNKLLEEVEEDILVKPINDNTFDESKPNNDDSKLLEVKEKYEDYCDEFIDDDEEVEEIPDWYDKMIHKKIKETKQRLENLSTLVCYASSAVRKQIERIEQDHNSVFCKLDYPRYPSLKKPWLNYWRFNCVIKCKLDTPEPYHAHTDECETIMLEHVGSKVTTKSKNIFANEFPEYIMNTVEVFQEFVNITYKRNDYYDGDEIPDTVYEKPMWSYIKIRSNYKNELMLIACGKGVSPLLTPLKRYFKSGQGRSCNVVSLYCINIKWSQKKSQFPPTFITGCLELRDKIGPISINYNPKTNINFNSIEAQELGKSVLEYLAPTAETTVIDLGCNIGVLSLMLAQKSDKVIGLNSLDFEIKMAEEVKNFNGIHNATFIVCTPREVQTKCSPLVKKCISVAVLNQATPFGKAKSGYDVMRALRNLPTIWRVVVYGPFTKEFHKNITVLTSRDESMGDEFLPMQGCILDKCPSNPNAFDIIILFERKSLIEPSVELIASGPTVNLKTETDYSCNKATKIKEENVILKMEKGFGNNPIKNSVYKPYPKYNRSFRKYGGFDSPLLPMKNEQKPEIPSKSEEKQSHSVFKPSPSFIDNPRKTKSLRRRFDSPLLPIKTETSSNELQSEDDQHHSPPKTESNNTSLKCPSPPNITNSQLEDTSISNNQSTSIIKVKKEFNYPISPKSTENHLDILNSVKSERIQESISTSTITENYVNDTVSVNIEDQPTCSQLQIKSENVYLDKEEGELSPESQSTSPIHLSDVNIKPEPMDLDDEGEGLGPVLKNTPPNNVMIKSELVSANTDSQTFPNIYIKSEPLDYNNVTIKSEPTTLENFDELSEINDVSSYSESGELKNIEDIANMETPKHNAAALAKNRELISPIEPSTNFTTIDGFHLSVNPNQSFLDIKSISESIPVTVKTESVISIKQEAFLNVESTNTHDDVCIIGEKIERRNSRENKIKSRFDIKSELEDSSDLRSLIEKRKDIQKQLNRENSHRKSRVDRSSSPEWKRRYRSPRSSPYRSPLSPERPNWRRRSPSPRYKITSPKYRRGSPSSPRNRRISPFLPRYTKYQSPTSPRYRRSSPPPYRRVSPYSKRDLSPIRSRQLSPFSYAYRRSPPVSPKYKYRRSPSPYEKRKRKRRSRSSSLSSSSQKTKSSSKSSKHNRKRSPSTKDRNRKNNKNDDQWDIPALSMLIKKQKSGSPTKSPTSSTSSSTSFSIKQDK